MTMLYIDAIALSKSRHLSDHYYPPRHSVRWEFSLQTAKSLTAATAPRAPIIAQILAQIMMNAKLAWEDTSAAIAHAHVDLAMIQFAAAGAVVLLEEHHVQQNRADQHIHAIDICGAVHVHVVHCVLVVVGAATAAQLAIVVRLQV